MHLRSVRFPFAFLLVAGLFLWPIVLHPDEIPVRPNGQESDLLLSHLPNADYWRWSLARYGQWPLWNAQILAGQPFAANPLSGIWYPPNLVLLLPGLPLPVAFNLLLVLHVAWAGYGVFRLLQVEGLRDDPAFFGGLAFAATPKLIAHLAAGHVSLIAAVAWTPWLLLAGRALAARPTAKTAVLAGAVLASMFLADVRWAMYAGPLAGAYGLATFVGSGPASTLPKPSLKALWCYSSLAALCFLLLSAVLLIPLVELIGYSNRSALGVMEAATYSLPPFPYLLGLMVPLPGVIHEWVTYAGLAPFALALVGFRRRLFWAAAGVAAALFALGSNGFLFPLFVRWVPGLSLLRVPSRAWFIVALAVCLLAAHGWQHVSNYWKVHFRPARYARLGLLMLLVITSVDLLWMNNSLLEVRPLPAPSPAATWLATQPGLFRVYSSSASLPLPDRLQHVEGVDPLHLAALADFVAQATHIGGAGYSVSVPAILSSDRATTPLPSAQLLGWLNVRYVVAESDIVAPEFSLVQQFATTRIYENLLVQPRAWMANGGDVQIESWSPDSIVVRAITPGLLILSEVAYPGWEARIDGRQVPIETVDGLLRGVRVGSDKQVVELSYRPLSVLAGGLLSLAGLGAVLGVLTWAK